MQHVTDLSSLEARPKFGELLDRAYYQNAQYRITRNGKPLARIVGEPFMETVVTLIDHIIENQPSLADTLAIMVNEDAQKVIKQGTQEKKEGKILPIESILDEHA